MEDDDRGSNASSEHEPYDAIDDGDDDHNENDDDGNANGQAGESTVDGGVDGTAEATAKGTVDPTTTVDDMPKQPAMYTHDNPFRPVIAPSVLTAKSYDIVPTMAAPMSTSINALAVTPDLRYWMTGGSDCYIRKHNGPDTINGKLPLTVAQRHSYVETVHKAGILMSYWANEEPPTGPLFTGTRPEEPVLSPVYSLAVHSQALWLLAGCESGAINLQSVRHDEGKRIHSLQKHTNAVSVLQLAPDERSVLSGSWDKFIFDWDLDTGAAKRDFYGNSSQISSIELRPQSGAPIPAAASEEAIPSDTFSSNIDKGKGLDIKGTFDQPSLFDDTIEARDFAMAPPQSPDHESLFGGSDAGSLFGDNNGGGGGGAGFGGHDDDYSLNAFGDDGGADLGLDGLDSSTNDLTISGPLDPPHVDVLEPNEVPEIEMADHNDATFSRPGSSHQPLPSPGLVPPLTTTTRPSTPTMTVNYPHPPQQYDPTQMSNDTFLASSIDGTMRIWDKRMPNPPARIRNQSHVPPWCMAACWSPDGNWIYAGRRNGTVEEFSIHKASSSWAPQRSLKFPQGSGPISAVRAMPNGKHLVCASQDILRLYDLSAPPSNKSSHVPFLVIPGAPRPGVTSHIYLDPTYRFMISTAGTRGWEGTCWEALVGYEVMVKD